MILLVGLIGFLVLQNQNVFSQARQSRAERFRHSGVIWDEDRSAASDPRTEQLRRPPVLTT
jgi:hypothetical protein